MRFGKDVDIVKIHTHTQSLGRLHSFASDGLPGLRRGSTQKLRIRQNVRDFRVCDCCDDGSLF